MSRGGFKGPEGPGAGKYGLVDGVEVSAASRNQPGLPMVIINKAVTPLTFAGGSTPVSFAGGATPVVVAGGATPSSAVSDNSTPTAAMAGRLLPPGSPPGPTSTGVEADLAYHSRPYKFPPPKASNTKSINSQPSKPMRQMSGPKRQFDNRRRQGEDLMAASIRRQQSADHYSPACIGWQQRREREQVVSRDDDPRVPLQRERTERRRTPERRREARDEDPRMRQASERASQRLTSRSRSPQRRHASNPSAIQPQHMRSHPASGPSQDIPAARPSPTRNRAVAADFFLDSSDEPDMSAQVSAGGSYERDAAWTRPALSGSSVAMTSGTPAASSTNAPSRHDMAPQRSVSASASSSSGNLPSTFSRKNFAQVSTKNTAARPGLAHEARQVKIEKQASFSMPHAADTAMVIDLTLETDSDEETVQVPRSRPGASSRQDSQRTPSFDANRLPTRIQPESKTKDQRPPRALDEPIGADENQNHALLPLAPDRSKQGGEPAAANVLPSNALRLGDVGHAARSNKRKESESRPEESADRQTRLSVRSSGSPSEDICIGGGSNSGKRLKTAGRDHGSPGSFADGMEMGDENRDCAQQRLPSSPLFSASIDGCPGDRTEADKQSQKQDHQSPTASSEARDEALQGSHGIARNKLAGEDSEQVGLSTGRKAHLLRIAVPDIDAGRPSATRKAPGSGPCLPAAAESTGPVAMELDATAGPDEQTPRNLAAKKVIVYGSKAAQSHNVQLAELPPPPAQEASADAEAAEDCHGARRKVSNPVATVRVSTEGIERRGKDRCISCKKVSRQAACFAKHGTPSCDACTTTCSVATENAALMEAWAVEAAAKSQTAGPAARNSEKDELTSSEYESETPVGTSTQRFEKDLTRAFNKVLRRTTRLSQSDSDYVDPAPTVGTRASKKRGPAVFGNPCKRCLKKNLLCRVGDHEYCLECHQASQPCSHFDKSIRSEATSDGFARDLDTSTEAVAEECDSSKTSDLSAAPDESSRETESEVENHAMPKRAASSGAKAEKGQITDAERAARSARTSAARAAKQAASNASKEGNSKKSAGTSSKAAGGENDAASNALLAYDKGEFWRTGAGGPLQEKIRQNPKWPSAPRSKAAELRLKRMALKGVQSPIMCQNCISQNDGLPCIVHTAYASKNGGACHTCLASQVSGRCHTKEEREEINRRIKVPRSESPEQEDGSRRKRPRLNSHAPSESPDTAHPIRAGEDDEHESDSGSSRSSDESGSDSAEDEDAPEDKGRRKLFPPKNKTGNEEAHNGSSSAVAAPKADALASDTAESSTRAVSSVLATPTLAGHDTSARSAARASSGEQAELELLVSKLEDVHAGFLRRKQDKFDELARFHNEYRLDDPTADDTATRMGREIRECRQSIESIKGVLDRTREQLHKIAPEAT